jgi:hypothetical protein
LVLAHLRNLGLLEWTSSTVSATDPMHKGIMGYMVVDMSLKL